MPCEQHHRRAASTRAAILVFLAFWCYCLSLPACAYAMPRVTLQQGPINLPTSNVQVHHNITSANSGSLSSIDEVSYIDFEPSAGSSKRPNMCNDCVCGVGRTSRIIGGSVTSVNEYPWLVSLWKDGMFYCAGSLITRKHVLTASHCLEGFDSSSIKLLLMDSSRPRIGPDAIVRSINSVTLHDAYHSYTFNNDIALIEMDEPVPVDGVIKTVCLPEDRAIDYTGAMATVVGWGKTAENQPVSDELRKVHVPILSQEECDQAGYSKNRLTDNMFCAGYLDGERDACYGDSGGPLQVKGSFGQLEMIGIISWGRGCGRPKFPGIYTKLNNYLGWLKDHLDGECVCPPPNYRR